MSRRRPSSPLTGTPISPGSLIPNPNHNTVPIRPSINPTPSTLTSSSSTSSYSSTSNISHSPYSNLLSPPPASSSRGRSNSLSPTPSPINSPNGEAPSYTPPSVDRSPTPSGQGRRSKVPRPIFLRSSSPQGQSSKGTLKIHVPAWGIVLLNPPTSLDLHPLESQNEPPPANDTLLTGTLEVIMKERRRCQAISVGVQSVCRLHMGVKRGWEEDGVFERGVEVLGGNGSGSEEGIWLEKGSQSFTFSILLPATLATHDYHQFGRLSYILTARVEGIPPTSTNISSLFRRDRSPSSPKSQLPTDIPFREDFESVIARSDKITQDLALSRSNSRGSTSGAGNGGLTPPMQALGLSGLDEALSLDDGPVLGGLYHRRPSADIPRTSPVLGVSDDTRSIHSVSTFGAGGSGEKSEKNGWMRGDLTASRSLIIHANPSVTGGVSTLDVRKEGFVEGLNSWRFTATSEAFSISAVILLSMTIPSPGPKTTIFFTRLLLSQVYKLTSPRTPNERPHHPESARMNLIYQIGKPHKTGERFPGHDADALWRGRDLPVTGNYEEGWKTRAVARLPNHEKIRPSTNDGTITPIRVSHDLVLQVFYSVEGESVAGGSIEGPGELRMMAVRLPVQVPSCCCTVDALNLPTYQQADVSPSNIDEILSSPPTRQQCMCGHTFAELGEAAMKRLQTHDQETEDSRVTSGGESVKSGEMRRDSHSRSRDSEG